MKSQTTKIYSQLDEEDIKLIAALLRELGYGAEGFLKSAKININCWSIIHDPLCESLGNIETEWEYEAKHNA